jgi:hypothetical protein
MNFTADEEKSVTCNIEWENELSRFAPFLSFVNLVVKFAPGALVIYVGKKSGRWRDDGFALFSIT